MIGCGWKGSKGKWPDHLRRDCPEVEDDNNSQRQARTGSVPLAIRREAEEEEARAVPDAEAARDRNLQIMHEVEDMEAEDLDAPMLSANDKKVGAICDVCHTDIFNEGYLCEYMQLVLSFLQPGRTMTYSAAFTVLDIRRGMSRLRSMLRMLARWRKEYTYSYTCFCQNKT